MIKAIDPTKILPVLAGLRNGLADANDSQLRQVVAMVDSLAQRGPVDEILAPVRRRLVHIRPPRPLRFSRLLFLPLDPIIVRPQDWTSGIASLPRTAITPLADLVHTAMGDTVAPIDTLINDRSTADIEIISKTGATLWPAAAAILAKATCPTGWHAAGLPDNIFGALAQLTHHVLLRAPLINQLSLEQHGAIPEAAKTVEQVLDNALEAGPVAWRVVLLVLLLRMPDPKQVLRAATTTTRTRNTAIRVATEQALEAALDTLERSGPADSETAQETAIRLSGIATLLDGITTDGVGPGRARRIAGLRASLTKTCQTNLKTGLAEQVLAPLRQIPPTTGTRNLESVEQAARSLRNLEIVGRKLGGAEAYDQLLRQAAAEIQTVTRGTDMTPVERARLVELLAGPEAALAVLQEGRARQSA